MHTVTIKVNPQYLCDIDGIDRWASLREWETKVRMEVLAFDANVVDVIEDHDLHETWSWVWDDGYPEMEDRNLLAQYIDMITERGSWQAPLAGWSDSPNQIGY